MAPLDMILGGKSSEPEFFKMNQLCKVCGEPAAGYHFGAFTCEGCKSFFGRTYNNLAALGECKNSGQCVINKKNRTSCKSCRLKKCLLVGMSKSGSRYGRRSNWFKIHCLIQDQAEMTSRLADQGVLPNGQLTYDTKDIVHRFRSEYTTETQLPTANGSTSRGSPASDPGHTGTTSPLNYNFYSPKNGYSNGYSNFDGSSPPYERKENMAYPSPHHHLNHSHTQLPLSPVSPLHPSKFFFHHPAPNGNFFSKNFSPLPTVFNQRDINYSPPQRLLQIAPGVTRGASSLLRPVADGVGPGTECYADVPEQEKPIDLSMKKPETPTSEETVIDDNDDDDEFINMADDEDDSGESCLRARAETPLDLTSKKTVSC